MRRANRKRKKKKKKRERTPPPPFIPYEKDRKKHAASGRIPRKNKAVLDAMRREEGDRQRRLQRLGRIPRKKRPFPPAPGGAMPQPAGRPPRGGWGVPQSRLPPPPPRAPLVPAPRTLYGPGAVDPRFQRSQTQTPRQQRGGGGFGMGMRIGSGHSSAVSTPPGLPVPVPVPVPVPRSGPPTNLMDAQFPGGMLSQDRGSVNAQQQQQQQFRQPQQRGRQVRLPFKLRWRREQQQHNQRGFPGGSASARRQMPPPLPKKRRRPSKNIVDDDEGVRVGGSSRMNMSLPVPVPSGPGSGSGNKRRLRKLQSSRPLRGFGDEGTRKLLDEIDADEDDFAFGGSSGSSKAASRRDSSESILPSRGQIEEMASGARRMQQLQLQQRQQQSQLPPVPAPVPVLMLNRSPSPPPRTEEEVTIVAHPTFSTLVGDEKKYRRQQRWLQDRYMMMLDPNMDEEARPHLMYGPEAERERKVTGLEELFVRRTGEYLLSAAAVSFDEESLRLGILPEGAFGSKEVITSRPSTPTPVQKDNSDDEDEEDDDSDSDSDSDDDDAFDRLDFRSLERARPPAGFSYFGEERDRIRGLRTTFQEKFGKVYLYRNLYCTSRVPPWFREKGTLSEDQCLCEDVCDRDCLNRAMRMECVSCHLGPRCSNDGMQMRRWIRCRVADAGQKGYGLFALEPMRRGQFVMEYVGEILDEEQMDMRQQKNQRHCYFFSLDSGLTIDASLKGNEARFMNHSCDANCQPQKWVVDGEPRIGLFAVKDIQVGDELTFDYSFENLNSLVQKCFCGAPNCRGVIAASSAPEVQVQVQGQLPEPIPDVILEEEVTEGSPSAEAEAEADDEDEFPEDEERDEDVEEEVEDAEEENAFEEESEPDVS